MQDLIAELKNKIILTNKRGAIDDAKANKEIQRLQNSLLELQTKFNHFANVINLSISKCEYCNIFFNQQFHFFMTTGK